uniref:Inner membrane translocon protein Ycf1 n=1 Tax=Rhopalocnemis phalloides TaxID=1128106 RepID=A0A3Q8R2J7_9MAGN|nr:inner membrane translocon protein Ycf1 [Rhopalocnemis phalloides]
MLIQKKLILNIIFPILLIIVFSKFYYWILFNFNLITNFNNKNLQRLNLNQFSINFLNNYIIFFFLIIYYIPIYLDYIYIINICILLYFIFLIIFQNNNINNTIIIKFLFFNNIFIQLIKYSFIYNTLIIRILHNYFFRFIYKFNILIFFFLFFIYSYLIKYLACYLLNYKYILILKLKINNTFKNLIKKYYNYYYIYYILYFTNIFITYICILKNLYMIILFFIIINYLEIITFFYKFNITKKQEMKQFVHKTKFGKIKFNFILCFETIFSDLFLNYKKNKEPLRYNFIKNYIINEVSQFFFYEIYQIDGLKKFSFTYPYNLSYIFEFLKKNYKIEQFKLNIYYLKNINYKLIKLLQLNNIQIKFNNIIIQNYINSKIYYTYNQIKELNNFNINYNMIFIKNNKEIEEDSNEIDEYEQIEEDSNEIDEYEQIEEDSNEIFLKKLNINKLYIIFLKIFHFNKLNKNKLIIKKIIVNIVSDFIYNDESYKNFVKYTIYLKKIYKKQYKLIYNKIKKKIIKFSILKKIKIKKSIEIKFNNYNMVKFITLSELDKNLKLKKIKDKLFYLRYYYNIFNFLRNLSKGSSRNKRKKVNIYNLIQLNLKSLLFQFIYKIYQKKNYKKIIKKTHKIQINQILQYIPFIYLINTFLLLFQLNFRKYIKLPLLIYIKCKIFKIDNWEKNLNQLKLEKYIYCTFTGMDFSEKYFPKNWLNKGLQIKIVSPFDFNSNKINEIYFLTIFGGLKQHILLINKKKYNKINLKIIKIKYLFIFIISKFINIFKFNNMLTYKKFDFNFNNSFLQSYILYCILKLKYNTSIHFNNFNQLNFINQKNKKKNYNYFYNNIFNYILVDKIKKSNLFINKKKIKNIKKKNKIINQIKLNHVLRYNFDDELKLYYIFIKAMNKKYSISMINLQNIQIDLLNELNKKNENISLIYNIKIKYNYYNNLIIKQCIHQNFISLIPYDSYNYNNYYYNNYYIKKFFQQIILFIYFKNINKNFIEFNNLHFLKKLNLKFYNNFSHTIFINSIFEDLIFINIIINKFYLFKLKI